MVTVIKQGISKASILKLLEKFSKSRGIDAKKYCGVIKLKESPLKLQKSLRDEWA